MAKMKLCKKRHSMKRDRASGIVSAPSSIDIGGDIVAEGLGNGAGIV